MGVYAGGGFFIELVRKGSGVGEFEKEVLNGGAGGVGHAVGGSDLS